MNSNISVTAEFSNMCFALSQASHEPVEHLAIITPGSIVTKRFKVGDHVSWNSEAGRVNGTIIRIHTKDVPYKGYTHHATHDEPQYEIKSDKSDHLALHKGVALTKLRR